MTLSKESIISAINTVVKAYDNRELTQAEQLRRVAATLVAARHSQAQKTADILREVAGLTARHIDDLAEASLSDLREKTRLHDIWGLPPSFIRVGGQSDLEKPFNRLLGWWSDVRAEHGVAKEFLRRLAVRAGLPEMAEDLMWGDPVVKVEQCVEGITEGRMPDLMVMTERAALLLENKVWAQESGDQYAPYLSYLEKWAEGRRYAAFLTARQVREIPKGWSGFIPHNDLADIFDSIWHMIEAPVWGRIAAKITAVTFRDDTAAANAVADAKILLDHMANGKRKTTPGLLTEVERLMNLMPEAAVLKGDSDVWKIME
jgi:hypothetical protein